MALKTCDRLTLQLSKYFPVTPATSSDTARWIWVCAPSLAVLKNNWLWISKDIRGRTNLKRFFCFPNENDTFIKNLDIKSNNSRTTGIVINLANSVCTAPGCKALETICLPIHQTTKCNYFLQNISISCNWFYIYHAVRAF